MTDLDPEKIAKILSGFQTSVSLLQDIGPRLQDNTIIIAKMEEKLEHLKEDVESLSKILKDGNGSALITRMTLAEEHIKQLSSEQRQERNEEDRGRSESHSMKVSIISGLLALLAAIFAAYIGFLK